MVVLSNGSLYETYIRKAVKLAATAIGYRNPAVGRKIYDSSNYSFIIVSELVNVHFDNCYNIEPTDKDRRSYCIWRVDKRTLQSEEWPVSSGKIPYRSLAYECAEQCAFNQEISDNAFD